MEKSLAFIYSIYSLSHTFLVMFSIKFIIILDFLTFAFAPIFSNLI